MLLKNFTKKYFIIILIDILIKFIRIEKYKTAILRISIRIYFLPYIFGVNCFDGNEIRNHFLYEKNGQKYLKLCEMNKNILIYYLVQKYLCRWAPIVTKWVKNIFFRIKILFIFLLKHILFVIKILLLKNHVFVCFLLKPLQLIKILKIIVFLLSLILSIKIELLHVHF